MRVGIDLMGSETSPQVLCDAASSLSTEADFIFYGDSEKLSATPEFLIDCKEEISLSDNPLTAVRKKQRSSLVRGLLDLASGDLNAFVTAGNTGALTAASSLFLPKLMGTKRLGLLAELPTQKLRVAVIDVGAHLKAAPHHYLQYAKLGTRYMQKYKERPCIGMLNIGTEERKGGELQLQVHALLSNASFPFVGNVEPRDVFAGACDVLITDAFSGNLFLKTAEGVAELIFRTLKKESLRNFSYAAYPGALLMGVNAIVVKCHSYSSLQAFASGISGAVAHVQDKLLDRLRSHL